MKGRETGPLPSHPRTPHQQNHELSLIPGTAHLPLLGLFFLLYGLAFIFWSTSLCRAYLRSSLATGYAFSFQSLTCCLPGKHSNDLCHVTLSR